MLWEKISEKISEKNWTVYKLCLKAGIGPAGIYRLMIHALQELKKLKEGQSILSADVDYLKNEQPINPSVGLALEKLRKKKVVALLGGKDSQAYRDRHFAQSVNNI